MSLPDSPIRVGVAGATGYVGIEFIRLLLKHPAFELVMAGSKSYAGRTLASYAPAFHGATDLILTDAGPAEFTACDLVITALPHGVSSEWIAVLADADVMILDHSGDFRFRSQKLYEKTYKLTHPRPDLLAKAEYGFPEAYHDRLPGAQLIANPGCYPTCSLTPLLPFIGEDLLGEDIIIDAFSGTTGAGRKADPEYGFSEMAENLKPYGVTGHRHQAEIREQLERLGAADRKVSFTPHLAPIRRGMLSTVYFRPTRPLTQENVDELLLNYYEDRHFVRVLCSPELPQTRPLIGTNFVTIAARVDEDNGLIKLFSALDNLGKGAAGQAIQALNVHYGFPETMGLEMLPQFI